MTGAEILDCLREINQKIVRVESPDELKREVCEFIAESTSYVFAWIGSYDNTTNEIVPEAAAGIEEGYLDTITITVDEAPTGQGPTGRAVRTRTAHAMQNILDDPAYEPWREPARERGYQSSIAVPLEYQDTLYGVLNVYADRPNAFAQREQTLLTELGETIAYALNNFEVQTRQRQQYLNLFEQAPVMYVLTREEGGEPVIDDCNSRFLDTLGYEKESVVGEPLATFYSSESARELREYGYDEALAGDFVLEERTLVTTDGDEVQTQIRAVPRIGPDGNVSGTLVLLTDVSERKQAEEVFRHAKALDASMDGVAIFNLEGECVYANDAFGSLHGYRSPQAAVGNSYEAFVSTDDTRRFRDEIVSTLDTQGTWRGEVTGLRTNGETFPAEVSVTNVAEVGVVCITRDITERKERERRLEEERERYERLTETAPDAILLANPDTREIVEVNTRAEELTGYSKTELVGAEPARIHPDDANHRELFASHLEAIRKTGPTLLTEFEDGSDIMVETKGGETHPVEINANLFHVGGERLVLGVFRDVSERKERERQLRELRQQYETVFQNTQDAMFLIDIDEAGTFRFTQFNQVEEEVTGLATEEVKNKTPHEILDDETAAQVTERYQKCVDKGETITYEEELSFSGEARVWETKLTPVVVDGEVRQLVGASRDITELREYENRLEAQRDQLELLNRIVRHDIRNDMSVVLGFADLVREEVPEESREDLTRILQTGRHVVELTKTARDLVEMVRESEESKTAPTDLGDALLTEVENTERSYPDATFHGGEEALDVRVKADELLPAVFRNILHNAVQHNDKDEPSIDVSVVDREESVVVRIADNGPGIPDERKDVIFGQEEKDLGSSGTGMGLYLVNTLVDRYDGEVWVENNEPEGSIFNVKLTKAETQ